MKFGIYIILNIIQIKHSIAVVNILENELKSANNCLKDSTCLQLIYDCIIQKLYNLSRNSDQFIVGKYLVTSSTFEMLLYKTLKSTQNFQNFKSSQV